MMPEFLMCPPSNFAVNYVGNIWMKPLQHINKERALIQWRSVRDALRTCGGKVHMLPVEKSLPDQVFAANIGVVSNKIFLSSNFRYRQRRKESVVARKWFRKKGFTVRKIPHSIRFEGMGDVIFIDRKSVAMGYGFRSSKGALHYVHSAGLCVPLHLHLIDPRFYHLDTCFVVVNGVAVFYPGAFDAASRKKIRNYFAKKIEVAEKDALGFVCNGVPVGKKYITTRLSLRLKSKLQRHGIVPVEIDVSEFLKSGGAVRCMVLDIMH